MKVPAYIARPVDGSAPGLPHQLSGKREDREGPVHMDVLERLLEVFPAPAKVHHSPNEIDLSGRNIARQIAKNRERGTLSGFPDFVVFLPDGMALFIEVKAPTGGKLSKDQAELRRDLELMGFRYAVVRSVDELDAALRSWGFIT